MQTARGMPVLRLRARTPRMRYAPEGDETVGTDGTSPMKCTAPVRQPAVATS